jgi:hypothetical protein
VAAAELLVLPKLGLEEPAPRFAGRAVRRARRILRLGLRARQQARMSGGRMVGCSTGVNLNKARQETIIIAS